MSARGGRHALRERPALIPSSRPEMNICQLQQFRPRPPMRRPRRRARRRPRRPPRRRARRRPRRPPRRRPRRQPRRHPQGRQRRGRWTAITKPGTSTARKSRIATATIRRWRVQQRRRVLPGCSLRCRPSRPAAESYRTDPSSKDGARVALPRAGEARPPPIDQQLRGKARGCYYPFALPPADDRNSRLCHIPSTTGFFSQGVPAGWA